MKRGNVIVIALLIAQVLSLVACSDTQPTAKDSESVETTAAAVTEALEEEYSVTSFDEIEDGTVERIVIRDVYTREEASVTDADKIGEIISMVRGVGLTYTGMTSKGCYDARVTIFFCNGSGDKVYSHITLYSGKRCEYKENSRDSYFNIYDMENGDRLFDTVMAYVDGE